MEKDDKKVLKLWSMIRWFMVLTLFVIGMLKINIGEQIYPTLMFIGVFMGIIILNLLYQLNVTKNNHFITSAQIILDLVFATLIVHLTGGLSSYFVWIYLLGIITASLMVPQMGGILTGLIGSISLFVLILLYKYNILINTASEHDDFTLRTMYMLSYTALFCGVAMIASYITEKLSTYSIKYEELSNTLSETLIRAETAERSQIETERILKQSKELVKAGADIAHLDHDLNTPLCIISLSIGRVKRQGMMTNDESLLKSSNEITEALNKINAILQRLIPLKTNNLIRTYEEGRAHEQKNIGSR